jgi:GTP-binding protein YchF
LSVYNPAMRAGIIGLPSVGKSTLFELLTGAPTPPPGARPEARVGIARVPDARVERLAEMFKPRKKTLATVEYVDVPGVQKGHGSTLVDLPALRNIDVFVEVVRAFESDVVPHSEGTVDPLRDARFLELELILADLTAVDRRLERLELNIKKMQRSEDEAERALFLRLKEALEAERPLREVELSEDERRSIRNYSLLTEKPLLLVVNLGEDQLRDAAGVVERAGLKALASRPRVELCPVSATIETEIARLGADDARLFLEDLGLSEPGLDRVIRASYSLLGFISFLTAGEDECRAWTIRKGIRAQEAAGTVHSDIERGFIRAEVIPFDSLVEAGSLAAGREKGWLKLEGKDYLVRDGDVVHFRFNV